MKNKIQKVTQKVNEVKKTKKVKEYEDLMSKYDLGEGKNKEGRDREAAARTGRPIVEQTER